MLVSTVFAGLLGGINQPCGRQNNDAPNLFDQASSLVTACIFLYNYYRICNFSDGMNGNVSAGDDSILTPSSISGEPMYKVGL